LDDYYHVLSVVRAHDGLVAIVVGLVVAGKQMTAIIMAKVNARSSERIAQTQTKAQVEIVQIQAKAQVEIARIQRGKPTRGRRGHP
jgi:hypothetical protein